MSVETSEKAYISDREADDCAFLELDEAGLKDRDHHVRVKCAREVCSFVGFNDADNVTSIISGDYCVYAVDGFEQDPTD